MRALLQDRRSWALLVLTGVAGALQWPLWDWEVEDAAISLAYVRNFVAGDGLVPQIGAERVEGFSDPLWVALLSGLHALGADPFTACRVLGMVFGCLTVPAVFAALRPIEREHPLAPVWGAAAAALFAPHVIWAQSGLENALFSFLLAAGCARLGRDRDREWLGPLLFFGLAWTRPEGIAYAGIAGIIAIAAGRTPARMATRTAVWTLAFGLPFVLSELAALAYFAQELPATYHAKLGDAKFLPFVSRSRGWTQLVGFASDTRSFLLVPLMVLGATGMHRARWAPAVLAIGLLAAARAFDPVVPMVALFLSLPLLALRRPLPIGLAASLLILALGFQIGTNGDWMRGYRWMSLATVPGAMLLGVGIAELAARNAVTRVGVPLLASLLAVPHLMYVWTYDQKPETDPPTVHRRVRHWESVAERLHVEHRPRIIEHDMGGSLYYGGEFASYRDAVGLVDLPFALYGAEKSVVVHEIFSDRPFEFAHAHASTLVVTRPRPEFRKNYVEIEGYGRGGHRGQYIRRSLVFDTDWPGAPMPIAFSDEVSLLGVSVPSPEIAAGAGVFFEFGMKAGKAPVRLLAFLSDGQRVLASGDLPPAWDWVPTSMWRREEVFHGRFSLRVPPETPEGRYHLGFVAFDAAGAILPVESAAAPAQVPAVPVFAAGEVWLPEIVQVVSGGEMRRLAFADRDDALSEAAAGRCEAAEAAWMRALHHRTRSQQWRREQRPEVARALAACHAARAGSGSRDGEDLVDRVLELERARLWDPREATLATVGAAIAEEAHARAVASDMPETRFVWFEAAVRANPSRAWDRRWAEQARGTWVGVQRPSERAEPDRD